MILSPFPGLERLPGSKGDTLNLLVNFILVLIDTWDTSYGHGVISLRA
jgi:hypothetical protein